MKSVFINVVTILTVLSSCNNKEESTDVTTEIQYFDFDIETLDPPPVGYYAPFKSIRQWLMHVVENEKTDTAIYQYEFGLSEDENNNSYILDLAGTRSKPMDSVRKLDFKPAITYYDLKPAEVKGRDKKQVHEYIMSELKAFIKDPLFNESFFAKGSLIITTWNGEVIWRRWR